MLFLTHEHKPHFIYERKRTTTHSQLTEEDIKPNTIRLSIGTEHIDDILADLEQGFAAVK